MSRVIVVGGGIAGLTAAWRLQCAGHQVEVLERETITGGRMHSERRGGFIVDHGAQFLFSRYKHLHTLASELGLADQVRPVYSANNAILRNGQLYPGYGTPLGLLRSPLLSLGSKLRLPRILWEVWRQRQILDPHNPQLAASIDNEDLPVLLRRIVGDDALEYVFGPAFSATFLSDPEGISAAFALLALRFLLGGVELQSFEGGIGLLPATLAERLQVRSSCDVLRIESNSETVRVLYHHQGTQIETGADSVVVALPGSLVSGICASLTVSEQAFFRNVHYARGIVVFLMTSPSPPNLPYYGVAFPQSEGLDLYGLAVAHQKAGVAPRGEGLLNVALTERAARRMWNESDEMVVELALANLERTPIGRPQPIDAVVHRWDPMLPQFYVGYLSCVERFLARRERSPRLAFAGDYLVGPYIEAAVISGLRAAEEVEAVHTV